MARKKRWFAKILTYILLEIGTLMGVPMRPHDIEELTRQINDAVGAEISRKRQDDSGDPP